MNNTECVTAVLATHREARGLISPDSGQSHTEKAKTLIFLTNQTALPALTICDL